MGVKCPKCNDIGRIRTSRRIWEDCDCSIGVEKNQKYEEVIKFREEQAARWNREFLEKLKKAERHKGKKCIIDWNKDKCSNVYFVPLGEKFDKKKHFVVGFLYLDKCINYEEEVRNGKV